ncbi:MAG: malectin domain-containing carbohydrate-binding protein [Pirellulales bacterium]
MFQSERWDNAGGAEMNWAFPVTPGQYEVRLYFSEIYTGAFGVGLRTFSVQIEGVTVLQNYDTFADVGANAGVVKSFTVTSDANLNINFLHGVEDPAVKAIEILTAGPAATSALGTSANSLSFGNVTVGAGGQQSITLTNSGGSGAPSITISGTTISGTNANQFSDSFNDASPILLAPGQSTVVNVNFGPTSAGAKSASLQIAHTGSNNPLAVSLSGTGQTTPTGNIVYRVNAGGAAVAGTPGWTADTNAAPSQYRNSAAAPSDAATTTSTINLTNASIPAGTPQSLFQSERWDIPDATEMSWAFPVTAGLYEVRLYFSEFYTGTFAVGARTFDVQIEGATVLDNYDVFAEVGANAGVVKKFTVLSDPTLNIVFLHGVEDPAIKAIEIVSAGAVANQLVASTSTVDFGQVVVGQTSTKTFNLLNSGNLGDPSIVINPASAALTPTSAGFTYQFAQSQPITLTPGQSTTVTVKYSPLSVASNNATLAIPHSGTNSPLSVSLQGQGVSSIPIGFGKTTLGGTSSTSPTSLQFGPDGRLYVAQQNGLIKAYTVARNSANSYSVTATETISLIQQIPNHDDNGTLNASITTRQITGIVVTGTAASLVIYVSSSDPRIGAGADNGGNELNLDTNSGVVSRLTKSGSTWSRLDLVRGLPRSEEDHAPNGLQFDPATNVLYLAIGGNTNMGAPSNKFALLPEYALSAAILSINLTAIGQTTYDLPTLDDQTRAGVNDVNDPFGGNDGLNQAKLVPGGPVQVHAPGFRNPYDLLITSGGRMYTVSNGPNADWGDVPIGEGPAGDATNQQNEPGTTYGDGLHYITGPGYYGGHPNPTRSNPNNTFNSSNPQSPVSVGNPIESDFRVPGPESGALVVFPNSTNGLAEYTASNFGGAMQGDLLTASFDNSIKRIKLNSTGNTAVLSNNLFSTVGSIPLDVTVQNDAGTMPGTIWVADIATNQIYVFEPNDFGGGGGGPVDPNDLDGDHYTNADETANGTDPNNAGDVPPDFDADFTSNLLDPDDDNDTLPDTSDLFAVDAQNGNTTPIGTLYSWENNAPRPGGLLDLGFTGLMTNGVSNYQSLYDPNKLTPGGAAGVLTIDFASTGTALGSANTQNQAFQFGVNVAGATQKFVATTRVLSPWSGQTPQAGQQMGLFVGIGNQDNYIEVAVDGSGTIMVISEIAGAATTVASSSTTLTGLASIDFYLSVDPVNNTVQASYLLPGGARTLLGPAVTIPASWLSGAMAVGLISTTPAAIAPMPVTWDHLGMIFDTAGQLGTSLASVNFASALIGTPAQRQLTLTNLGHAGDPAITISGTTISGTNANQFSDSFNDATPVVLAPGQSTVVNVNFNPTSTGAKTASLQFAHNGSNNPLTISLTGTGVTASTGDVVYRVNAGGPAVSGTPGWTADTNALPSPYRNSAAAATGAFSTTSAINLSNASIPAGTPQSLFQSERWDNAGGAEMNWTFPVSPGQYEVRLYFSEIYTGAFGVGLRTFSVQIEGVTVLQNYDTFAEVGANAGVVKTFTITSDANLNISFLHGVEDPAVKAIEILTAGPAATSATTLASSTATGASAANSNLAFSVTVNPSSVKSNTAADTKSQSTIRLSATSSGTSANSQPIVQQVAETRKATNARNATDTVLGNKRTMDGILRDLDLLRPLASARKKR